MSLYLAKVTLNVVDPSRFRQKITRPVSDQLTINDGIVIRRHIDQIDQDLD